MRARTLSLLSFALAFAIALGALSGPVAAASYKEDLLADMTQLENKLVGLAEAIPADKYDWRPSEGVRSVSEALMHAAAANFFFPTLRGMKPPEGLDMQNLEKITDKDQVTAILKQSFAHARSAIEAVADDELDDAMKMFGSEVTVAGFLHSLAAHSHEHLGQLIAYARSNDVVPPWSAGGGN